MTSLSNDLISSACRSLPEDVSSANCSMTLLSSPPNLRSSGLKISCKSFVKALFPSKSQMAMGSGNIRLNAEMNLSLTRTQSLEFLRFPLGGQNAQNSILPGSSPGMRWIFLTRSVVPHRNGSTSAALSSPRRFKTCSVMPSKMPSASTGWFGSSK